MDCSQPVSCVHGILQVRILELVAILFSRRSSWPRDQIHISCLAGRFFTPELPGKPIYMYKYKYIHVFIHRLYLGNIKKKHMNSGRFWENKLGDLVKGGYFLFTYTLWILLDFINLFESNELFNFKQLLPKKNAT